MVPREIAQMTSLVKLDLSNNKIQSIPVEFHQLPNLVTLDIVGNPIIGIPNSIMNAGTTAIMLFLEEMSHRMAKNKN